MRSTRAGHQPLDLADEAPDAASGYPQLSVEYIVDADPDLIFLADTICCDQSSETVATRAPSGWRQKTGFRPWRPAAAWVPSA